MAIRFLDEEPQTQRKGTIRFLEDEPSYGMSEQERQRIESLMSRSVSPEEAESNIQGVDSTKQPLSETIVEQALQGATFGFGDEMQDALSALIGSALRKDKTFKDIYAEQRARSQPRLKAQQEDRPILSTTSQLVGGLGTGAAGAATKGGQAVLGSIGRSGLGGKVAKSAGLGAASGAVSGAGTSEGGAQERLAGAKSGATVGAALGGAIPAVGAVAGKVASGVKRATTGRKAEAILEDYLSNIDINKTRTRLQKTDDVIGLVDLAGDEAKGLLRSVAKNKGAKDAVSNFLEKRSFNAQRRLTNLLSEKVSNVDSYFANLEDVSKTRQAMSAPLYEDAFKKGANLKQTEGLNKLLVNPEVTKALKVAQRNYGLTDDIPINSVEGLDKAKKVLDDEIGAAIRSGKNERAKFVTEIKKDLVAEVDKQVPEYQKARKVFADSKALQNAQEQGLNFLKDDAENIKKTVQGLTAGEQDAYLIGVRKAAQNLLDTTTASGEAANKIAKNVAFTDKLKAAMPDRKAYNDLMKRVFAEKRAAETKFKVLGGSRSDYNIDADGALMIDAVETAAREGKEGIKGMVADALFTGVKNKAIGISDKNAKQISDILLDKTKGVEFLERVAKRNEKEQADIIKGFIPNFNKIRNQQLSSIVAGSTIGRRD